MLGDLTEKQGKNKEAIKWVTKILANDFSYKDTSQRISKLEN